jgi:hypothetical protein
VLPVLLFVLVAWSAIGAGAALGKGSSSISGTVTSAGTHLPIAGIEVIVFSTRSDFTEEEALKLSGGTSGAARTDANGHYTISGLNPESFDVFFGASEEGTLDYVSQLYDDKSVFLAGDHVTLAAGEARQGIDAALTEGGSITGRVTAAASGAAIVAAEACAFGPPGAHPPTQGGCSSTGVNGAYTLKGLAPGQYDVAFLAEGYAPQYYSRVSAEGQARTVTVTAGASLGGIDAALEVPITPEEAEGGSVAELIEGLPGPGAPGSPRIVTRAKGLGVSVAHTKISVTRSGLALVSLSCSLASLCHDRLTLRHTSIVHVKGRRHTHSIVLAGLDFLIRAGARVTEHVKLDRAALRLLHEHHGSISATASLSPAAPGAPHVASLVAVKLVRERASS